MDSNFIYSDMLTACALQFGVMPESLTAFQILDFLTNRGVALDSLLFFDYLKLKQNGPAGFVSTAYQNADADKLAKILRDRLSKDKTPYPDDTRDEGVIVLN